MKKVIVLTGVLVILTVSGVMADRSAGSVFGTFTTAKALGQGSGVFGGGVGIADATSVVGWFGYGMSDYIDGRLKLGLVDNDGGDTEISLGADFKYQFWSVEGTVANPIDMAVGGFIEYVDYGAASIFQIGGNVIGSYPFLLQNGTTLSPYGRFNVRLESWSLDVPPSSDSDSELEFGLNGGVAWQVSPTVTLYGEFQFDGNDGIFLGIDFSVL